MNIIWRKRNKNDSYLVNNIMKFWYTKKVGNIITTILCSKYNIKNKQLNNTLFLLLIDIRMMKIDNRKIYGFLRKYIIKVKDKTIAFNKHFLFSKPSTLDVFM